MTQPPPAVRVLHELALLLVDREVFVSHPVKPAHPGSVGVELIWTQPKGSPIIRLSVQIWWGGPGFELAIVAALVWSYPCIMAALANDTLPEVLHRVLRWVLERDPQVPALPESPHPAELAPHRPACPWDA